MEHSDSFSVERNPAVVLLGPTGSGKTPLGETLQRRGLRGMRCLHFDFGANLREIADTGAPSDALGPADVALIREVLVSGALLEDEHFPLARRVLRAFLARRRAERDTCIVLNGLPRHVGQARAMDGLVDVRLVVYLECSCETAVRRIQSNVGGDRTARADDDLESVRNKLLIFNERSRPLLQHYRGRGTTVETIEVAAETTAEQMWRALEGSTGLAGRGL